MTWRRTWWLAALAAGLAGLVMVSFAGAAGGIIRTVAGGGVGDGGPATSASLFHPTSVTLDGAGNLYIADMLNCRVREVSDGTISTVAGNGTCGYGGDGGPATSASLSAPTSVAVDGHGDVYIADTGNCRVREVSGGTISTVAGNGTCGYGGDGGPATSASLRGPYGIALDSVGDVYIADTGNCRVREVSGDTITTVAGVGTGSPFFPNGCGYWGDGGPATSAALMFPSAVALDGAGNLYIADWGNCLVREVSGGTIGTVAGNGTCSYGGDGGPAMNAGLEPYGVAVGGDGKLYIADANCRVREVSAGTISTVAGDSTCRYSGDGGPATSAGLVLPVAVALDSAGNLYVADGGNCRVREVSGGTIDTVAGSGCGYGGDGGPASSAGLNHPSGVAIDGAGDLYIADDGGCSVREVSRGTINTIVGNGYCGYSGDGGPATGAGLSAPTSVAIDGHGDVYIADTGNCRVREVSGGMISTIAGDGFCNYDSGDGGPATSASLSYPTGVALDGAGNLYIADVGGCRVRRVFGGTISTVAGNGTCSYGGDGGAATSASLNYPNAVAVDHAGNVYIAEECRVRKVSGGMITTVAGNGTCSYGGDGGPATSASLNHPNAVAADRAGNLYIADLGNCRIREVRHGRISTVAGNGTCSYGGDGGLATRASLSYPSGVAVDRVGNFYIADSANNRVREVLEASPRRRRSKR